MSVHVHVLHITFSFELYMCYEHIRWGYSRCWTLIFAQEVLFLHLFLSGQAPAFFEGIYRSVVQTKCTADWNHLVQNNIWRLFAILCDPETGSYRCGKPWGLSCIFIRYLDFKWFENCISSRGKNCWMASSPTLGNLCTFQYFRYFHKQIGTSRISLTIYHQLCSV